MISELIKVLKGIDLDPTAEDVADILWLAQFLDELIEETDKQNDLNSEILEKKKDEKKIEPELPVDDGDKKASPKADLYLSPSDSEIDSEDSIGLGGVPFRTPAGSALPGKLAISRSLRPIMRKIPSRHCMIIDENATARNIAESGIWMPTLRPKPSPWLDVVLVVDESPSMIIWYETIWELKELLERQGAFRNVQMWGFIYDQEIKSISLHAGSGFDSVKKITRDPRELVDPAGRRLILVVSDCVSIVWHDGNVLKMLKDWEEDSRVTIVQMLPHYLWKRTGLQKAKHVYFRSMSSNTVNSKLEIETFPIEIEEKIKEGLKLPVVTLESRALLPWAQSLAGRGGVWIPGVLLKLSQDEHNDDDIDKNEVIISDLTPEDKLRLFRDTASPEAQDLVKCLAALPLSLPVMRLAQRAIFPNSRQIHLAEIMLSGLIKRPIASTMSVSPKEVMYEFENGIRELLISTAAISTTINALSVFIEKYSGTSIGFKAVLEDPSSISKIFKEDYPRQFAEVTAKVLRQFGGVYAMLAEQLIKAESYSKPKVVDTKIDYANARSNDVAIYDIFISYRTTHSNWVETLAHNLKAQNYSVFLPQWELLPGQDFTVMIHEALEGARCAILVATPGTSDSGWVQKELEMMINRKNSGSGFFFIPVAMGQFPDLPFVENVQAVDFGDSHPEVYRRAFQRLLSALKQKPPDLDALFEGDLRFPYSLNHLGRPLVQNEHTFLEEVFNQLEAGQSLMILAQADTNTQVYSQALREQAKVLFGSDNVYHIFPPNSTQADNAAYFGRLASQCHFTGETSESWQWGEAMAKKLDEAKDLFLLVTGFENGAAESRAQFAGELRQLKERYPAFHFIMMGGKQLAALKYAHGSMSLLNISEELHIPELDSHDLSTIFGHLYPLLELSPEQLQSVLEFTGSHPRLLHHCLQKGADSAQSCESILKQSPLPAQLFTQFREERDHLPLCALLNQDKLGKFDPWPADKLLRNLYWNNLITRRGQEFSWRCDFIRQTGREMLEC